MMLLNPQRVLAFIVLVGVLFFTGSHALSHHVQDTIKINATLNGKVETVIDGDTSRVVLHGKEKEYYRPL